MVLSHSNNNKFWAHKCMCVKTLKELLSYNWRNFHVFPKSSPLVYMEGFLGLKPPNPLQHCTYVKLKYLFLGGLGILSLVNKKYQITFFFLTMSNLSFHFMKFQDKSKQKFEAIYNNPITPFCYMKSKEIMKKPERLYFVLLKQQKFHSV